MSMNDGFFEVRFPSEEDLLQVLSRFHTFQGRAIIVKKWHKSIQLERDILAMVPIWMKVCDLPVHTRSGTSISKIVSNIAKPLYMDDVIESRDKGLYVHVLAEMEVDGVFLEIIQTRLHGLQCKVKVEYEWKPQVCTFCKKMDHLDAMCPMNKSKPLKPKEKWVVKPKIKDQEIGDLVSIQDEVVPKDGNEDLEGFTVQKKFKGKLKVLDEIPIREEVVKTGVIVIDEKKNDEEDSNSSPIQLELLENVVYSQEIVKETQEETSGRIWCGWDSLKIGVDVIVSKDQLINLKVNVRGTAITFFVTIVYAKNTAMERGQLWRDLEDVNQVIDGPWLLLGDWNIVRFNSEKKGGRIHSPRVFADFNNTIDKLCLSDMHVANGVYTWCNKRFCSRRINANLDRGLMNEEWALVYPDSFVFLTPPLTSDHWGLFFNLPVEIASSPRPFRFLLGAQFKGDSISKLLYKLKLCKKDVRQWNIDKFGSIYEEVISCRNKLEKLQVLLAADLTNDELIRKEDECRSNLEAAVSNESILLAQKSREEEVFMLEAEVIKEEVKDTIFAMGFDIAPGPDGFSARFFQQYWSIVGEDFTAAIFMVAKILANRLAMVLGRLVGNEQSTFIHDRRIQDNIIIANELMKGFGAKRTSLTLAWKIDLRKAYDSMQWTFLLKLLKLVGFGDQWIKWITECISSVWFSILINGTPQGFFQPERGLRHGCPLSSLLFTLVTDYFFGMMDLEVQKGRVELNRAVIIPMVQYWTSVYALPIAVSSCIERRMRNFVWGHVENTKKMHGIKWKKITAPNEEGGLGLRRIADIDTAEKITVWRSIIVVREILKVNCRYIIGTGQNIKVFMDPWCEGSAMVLTRKESSRHVRVDKQVEEQHIAGLQISVPAPAPVPVANEALDYFMNLLASEAWFDLMVRKLDSIAVPTD
ncbi:uncharacterized protein LOC132266226 [Cornus florida]|uniref:uncharacterized protein LOC132266226 n=1 Tax=Cornus florida TaxID=4283 RepID=UPI0028A1F1DE|nr:uncharacterized protein LOC132266226 [Cornus florida]